MLMTVGVGRNTDRTVDQNRVRPLQASITTADDLLAIYANSHHPLSTTNESVVMSVMCWHFQTETSENFYLKTYCVLYMCLFNCLKHIPKEKNNLLVGSSTETKQRFGGWISGNYQTFVRPTGPRQKKKQDNNNDTSLHFIRKNKNPDTSFIHAPCNTKRALTKVYR